MVEHFISSFATTPKELILDMDASDVPLHGNQELKQFHGYYDHHCYLPLYVFCGKSMLACLLRLVSEFTYAVDSWDTPRRVITRLGYGNQGNNPRFIVTNIAGSDAATLYERLYCAQAEPAPMLHASKTVNGMAVMVHADKIEVPAGGSCEFAPGGHHVMHEKPASTLQIGETLPITLWSEQGRAITTDCSIRSAAG